jgi:uncharacterized membrane-anchored protein
MNGDYEKGLAALRIVLAFSFISTTLHYAHNIIAVERYPQLVGISNTGTQVTVALGWVVLTVFGVLGYRRYRQRRYWPALAFLLVYSLSGLASAGHFLVGVPDVPVFWFATIFTDALAAMAIWTFVIWGATRIGQARNQVSTER